MVAPELTTQELMVVGTPLASAVLLGWYVRGLLAKIERWNEKRHRQNLERFRWVCVALTKLGYSNGQMPTFDD